MLTPEAILEVLKKHCDFPIVDCCSEGELISADNCERKIIMPLDGAFPAGETWDFEYGASKLVLIFRSLPFVVKIPFMGSGSQYTSQHCTVRTSVRARKNSSEFTSNDFRSTYRYYTYVTAFYNSKVPEGAPKWDYCSIEAHIYKKAKECGLDYLFAREERIGDVDGYPIYIQDKVVDFNIAPRKGASNKAYTIADSCLRSNSEVFINRTWCAQVVDKYGEEALKKLFNFIAANEINDIHDGNIGYTLNGDPILMDYSGFFG